MEKSRIVRGRLIRLCFLALVMAAWLGEAEADPPKPERVRLLDIPVDIWKTDKGENKPMITVVIEPPNTGDATRDADYVKAVKEVLQEWTDLQVTKYGDRGFRVKVIDPGGGKPDVTVKWAPNVTITVPLPGSGEVSKPAEGRADVMATKGGKAKNKIQKYTGTMVTVTLSTKVIQGPEQGDFRLPGAVYRIMQHEFGHAEGLPDFRGDPDPNNKEPLLMGPAKDAQVGNSYCEGCLVPLDLKTDKSVSWGKSVIHQATAIIDFIKWNASQKLLPQPGPNVNKRFELPALVPPFPNGVPLAPLVEIGVRLNGLPQGVTVPTGWDWEFSPDFVAANYLDTGPLQGDFVLNGTPTVLSVDGGTGWLYLFATDEPFFVPLTVGFEFDVTAAGFDPDVIMYNAFADHTVSFVVVETPEPPTLALIVLGLAVVVLRGIRVRLCIRVKGSPIRRPWSRDEESRRSRLSCAILSKFSTLIAKRRSATRPVSRFFGVGADPHQSPIRFKASG